MLAPRRFAVRGIKVLVFADAQAACQAGAERLIAAIECAQPERGWAVLGLSTGETPKRVYAHLVERHRAGSLSFHDVSTYNLDEYYPISPLDPRSYRVYMQRHLFSLVDIAPHCATFLTAPSPRHSWTDMPRNTTAGSKPMAGWTFSSWESAAMGTLPSTSPVV